MITDGVDVLSALLFAGGIFMMAHLILSQVLRVLVQWKSPLAIELFAVIPNAALGVPDFGVRLLNAKYFVPWIPSPVGMNAQPLPIRLVFWLTRIAGLACPLLWLAALAGAFFVQ